MYVLLRVRTNLMTGFCSGVAAQPRGDAQGQGAVPEGAPEPGAGGARHPQHDDH